MRKFNGRYIFQFYGWVKRTFCLLKDEKKVITERVFRNIYNKAYTELDYVEI